MPNYIFYSALRNPKVGQEAKQNAQAMLNELGGDQPREELHKARGDQNKDPVRVSAGLKA
jgi:Conidiation protein 6.